ncbi:MAG: DUF937 domain-containing protein [Pseudomonadales bacterium]
MDLMDMLLKGAGSSAIGEIAKNFNLDSNQTGSLLKKLGPALGKGLQRNTQSSGGLDSLMDALRKGNHDRYLDNPSEITSPAAVEDGNGILGHLFGDKEVSREVARRASADTGISDSIIKKMLPMIAGVLMGSLSKQQKQEPNFADAFGGGGQSAGKPGGMLGSLLDADGDGSIMDDLMSMAGKFLR